MFSQSGSTDIIYHLPCFGLIFLNPEEVGNRFVEDFIGTMKTGEKYQHYSMENLLDSEALLPSEIWASLSSSLQQAKNALNVFIHTFQTALIALTPISVSA